VCKAQVGDAQCLQPLRSEQRRAPEVGDDDLWPTVGTSREEDVAWLEILVQHVEPVGVGNGSRDIGEQAQAQVQRYCLQSALTLGPLGQVRPDVCTLDEIRVRGEIPLEDVDEVGTLAERCA
jgi:hypothetical protein